MGVLVRLAEKGRSDAMGVLRLICVDRNEEAMNTLIRLAEQGNEQGQYELGKCYEEGFGVEKDMAEAVKWYRKAAAQGEPNAKAALKNLGL